MQDGTVGVAADFHGPGRLAFVAEGVHVANDRVADLVVGLDQDIHGADVGHLVHGGNEGDVGVGQVGDLVRPHAAGNHDVLGLDRAFIGDDSFDLAHAGHRIVFGDQVEYFGVGEDLQAGLFLGFFAHHGAGLKRVDHRNGRAVGATQDDLVVDERHQLFDLGRGQELRLHAPRLGRGHAALQFIHAFLGAGNFDAAAVD